MLEIGLETIANLARLAASPAGQAVLDKLITGGNASPERVAEAVRQLEKPKAPKETTNAPHD